MNTRIVILAAGKGKRMKSELPKVLVPLNGKPMIEHLLESVKASGVDTRPLIVIGKSGDLVRKTLGEHYEYAVQEEQLGTGHAVQTALQSLTQLPDAIAILYGDHPFVAAATIRRLVTLYKTERPMLALMTTTVPDFKDWRRPFHDFGRIVRNQKGELLRITEKKDATDEELAIREINPALFCFSAAWLKENLLRLTNINTQHEYYLTDLVGIAIQQGARIASLDVSPLETIGVNTPEHLETLQSLQTT